MVSQRAQILTERMGHGLLFPNWGEIYIGADNVTTGNPFGAKPPSPRPPGPLNS